MIKKPISEEKLSLRSNHELTLRMFGSSHPHSPKVQHAAWSLWLADMGFDYFVTLTFREPVSERRAEEKMRRYSRLLTREVYGRNGEYRQGANEVVIFWVLEKHKSGEWHIHALFHAPKGEIKIAPSRFPTLIKALWRKITGAFQIAVMPIENESDEDTVGYCLKDTYFSKDRINITKKPSHQARAA